MHTIENGLMISVLNIDDDDDLVKYSIYLTNGSSSTIFELYGYNDEFISFADELIQFPSTINQVVTFQVGDNKANNIDYILLKVYCFEPNGRTAVKVETRVTNAEPYFEECKFSILTVPASINQLGQQLKTWNPKESTSIIWTAGE